MKNIQDVRVGDKVRVVVTQDHIDLGTCSDPQLCAIAMAVGQMFGEKTRVYGKFCRVDGTPFSLPPSARDFIRRFDATKSLVEPFEFEMECMIP